MGKLRTEDDEGDRRDDPVRERDDDVAEQGTHGDADQHLRQHRDDADEDDDHRSER
jgi:hypothetical protein